MKRFANVLSLCALTVFALFVLFPACEGPQGPAGADGADGTDGTDGVDANSWCIDCHTMANKDAINAQFATARHGGMNGSFGYAGGRNGCAKCHSYQGYMETMMTGKDTTAANVPLPVTFKCDMCHTFHGTLDETEFPDYALRSTEPVSLMYNGHASTVDLPGSGNVCAYCHQPRPRDGFPIEVNGAATIKVTSGHWGTHYGAQSVVLAGAEGFEIPGSMTYESSGHTGVVDCATCHMNKDGGPNVGGHTWEMNDPDGVENIAACTSCHSGLTTFDHNGIQTEIHGLVDELHHLLMDLKILDDTGHIIPTHNRDGSINEDGIGREFTSNEGGAAFNYFLGHYDHSDGVHNYKYMKALLVNTIEMVKGW